MDELREKVIRGLECCMAEKICTSKCPYKGQCDNGGYYYSKAIEDAISLLKAQEPRVITLEEANTLEVVWSEDRGTNAVFPCLVQNNMNDSKLYKYGIQWRVWSARPTEEQCKAVKWE